jgi:hypothetical protein
MPKKKKYMVVARDKKVALTGVTTQRGGHRSFGRKTSAMWIGDKAEAEEIDHTYGMKGKGDVFVVEDEKYSYALNGEQWDMKFDERGGHLKTVHHYTFSGVDMRARGGNEGVRVKTADGYTVVSRAVAVEEGLQIISKKRRPRAARREAKPNGI